jgi:3-oxoacyl-[acyl-carrier-protein] synthase II
MPAPERPRIGVTGLGVVSPLGCLPAFWNRLCAGDSGIVAAAPNDSAGPPAAIAPIRDWDAAEVTRAPPLRRMDRLSRMIVAAARMALADAALAPTPREAEEIGVVVGTAYGNVTETDHFIRRVVAKGPSLANPLTFPNTVLNAPAGYVAIDLGLHGPNVTVAHGEASGESALATAYDLLVADRAGLMLAGGGDEAAALVVDIYRDLDLLSPRDDGPAWSSPFDRRRNGLVLGEGAAMLVLEPLDRARARGARVYAEFAGHAAQHVPATPHDWPAAAAAAPDDTVRQLAALGWHPGETSDLVISCANSSARLDAYETAHLAALLGPATATTPVTSLRGAVGEFGGIGALSAVAAAMSLQSGQLPRLGQLREPDAGCPLALATRATRDPAGGFAHALVTATPRGGACLTLLFRRA